jgi:hypothetical protein
LADGGNIRRAAVVAVFAAWGSAFAAHPLQTEDTGTQGTGRIELENGLSWLNAGAGRVFTYQPQVSVGLSPSIDLIVQPSWLSARRDGEGGTHGAGDTNLDAKWRFFSAAPSSLAIRAGVTLATNQEGLGLPHGKFSAHALGVLSFDAAPFTVHANLGATQNPRDIAVRARIGRASTALMWAARQGLLLTAEAGVASNPDPARNSWPGMLLGAAIYTVRPGIDVDIGYRSSVRAATPAHEVQLGFTCRFSL